jgi:1-phosphofructokinase family hexose kinase
MITTVTLNPMLDKTVTVDSLRRGKVTRASHVAAVVGGKGVNVSRQLRALGEATVATGFAGGEVGSLLERLLDQEGIRHDFVRVAGMTREGVTYRETDGTVTSVFEPSHVVTTEEAARLIEKCRLLAGTSAWVVCSGSSPSSAADGVFGTITGECRTRGIPVVLDSYGVALERAVGGGPSLVKPNREEYEKTYGRTLNTELDMVDAARDLVRRGAEFGVITDGPRAFTAATREAAWIVTPPAVEQVNATGSGDSMIAALLHGMLQGWSFDDSLAFGAAAGAANARVWGVAAASRAEIVALLSRVAISRV